MYNVLVIGCGGQGAFSDIHGSENESKIISYAHAFKFHGGFNDIVFYDKDIKKAQEAAYLWKVCWTHEITHTLKNRQIDIAVIATNDDQHYETLKQLAEQPPKLVIAEKPLCAELDQARETVELYKQKNIPLMVNYTRRFLPYYDRLKEYGKPTYGRCVFNRGWLHTATHAIDFFNMIGCRRYLISEATLNKRVWQIEVDFENGKHFEESRIGAEPVWWYYDKSHYHVIENAYNFLQGKEPIKCTGEHALAALEKCLELMKGK
jgi:hypothetical protein